MSALQLLQDLSGRGVKLWVEGERLRYGGPREVVTPETVENLKEHKEAILHALTEPQVIAPVEVLEIARQLLPPLKEEDRVDLDELIEANNSPERGRDPLAKHETDKAHFFHASPECACDVCAPLPQLARRQDGKTYAGGAQW